MSVTTYAQKGFSLGINIQPGYSSGGELDYGLMYASGSSYYAFDKSFTLNMNIGADLGYNFDESMGVSSGLQYSHNGQNYASYSDSYNNKITSYISLNYLKIPFLLRYVFKSR